MASSEEFVTYIAGQLTGAGVITSKKMFGEYGFYCDGKFFACACDNQFFVKITDEGLRLMQNPETAPPYEGAKPYLLISDLDNQELLKELTIVTCRALPEPRPKKKGRNSNA